MRVLKGAAGQPTDGTTPIHNDQLARCVYMLIHLPSSLLIAIAMLRLSMSLALAETTLPPSPAGGLLERYCSECHNADNQEGGLDLSLLAFDPR